MLAGSEDLRGGTPLGRACKSPPATQTSHASVITTWKDRHGPGQPGQAPCDICLGG